MKRFNIDVLNAIILLYLIFVVLLWLLDNKLIENIPIMGTNNNEISNIDIFDKRNEFSSVVFTYTQGRYIKGIFFFLIIFCV